MSARHRAPAGTAAEAPCSARELIDRFGGPDTPGRAARRHARAGAAHRRPGPAGSPSHSTLTMLAVSAVGAGTAATGAFSAISAQEPAAPAPVVYDALVTDALVSDALVSDATSASPPPSRTAALASGDALITAAPAMAMAPATAAFTPAALPARASEAVPAVVLAEDTHQMDSRQIAALSRSVDLQRTARPSLTQPSALGIGDQAPGAARRASALSLAMGKLGVPYKWGATGPHAFDCSGLVMWAYKKVGVSVPRTSRAQSTYGTPVAKKDLRPGDLVFFYTPVSHVGIYLGNGKVVHASEPGKPVKVSPISRMPFHNARRV